MTYEEKRQMALERDNHRCLGCGKEANPHVHHPIPRNLMPSLTEELWNMMTLCPSCHKKAEEAFRKIYFVFGKKYRGCDCPHATLVIKQIALSTFQREGALVDLSNEKVDAYVCSECGQFKMLAESRSIYDKSELEEPTDTETGTFDVDKMVTKKLPQAEEEKVEDILSAEVTEEKHEQE